MHSSFLNAAAWSTATARGRVVASVMMVLALASFPPARADELQDVSKLVSAGDLDAAERRADAFLAKTPKDAQMRFLKGVILAQRGKRDEAVSLFTTITQDYPELPEPYNNMAVIFAARGEYDKARGALESAIRVSPQYATAYENLGDVYAALAARAYQDSRRYDANNGAALRKLDAARALLNPPAAASSAAPSASSSTSSSTAPATGDASRSATATAPRPQTTPSQRNVGLPSPAGPRVTVGGFGAAAPEIVVPADAAAIPQGSNVVAVETSASDGDGAGTSTLAGARTTVGADPAQPIAAVTAVVRRWAQSRSVTTDNLRIRVDGDTATAQFREAPATGRKSAATNRLLNLRANGSTWSVTDARVAP